LQMPKPSVMTSCASATALRTSYKNPSGPQAGWLVRTTKHECKFNPGKIRVNERREKTHRRWRPCGRSYAPRARCLRGQDGRGERRRHWSWGRFPWSLLLQHELVSDPTLMTSQREPCHESLDLSQQLNRTIALSTFDGLLMSVANCNRRLPSRYRGLAYLCCIPLYHFLTRTRRVFATEQLEQTFFIQTVQP